MEKQLLNFKTFLLVCLMTMLGGVNSFAADKITDVAQIVSGQKYYIGATTGGTDSYLSLASTDLSASVKGTAVGNSDDANVFVFEKTDNGWTIGIDGTSYYLSLQSKKDNGKVQIVDKANPFTISNKGNLIHIVMGNFAIQKNNSGTQFGSYASTQTDVWLMPVASNKTLTSLSISGEPTKKVYNAGEALDPTGLVVTGTYDDATTAKISSGITWTMNPETLSADNTTCTVTAMVGGVTSDPYVVTGLTITKNINCKFDFTVNPEEWGLTTDSKGAFNIGNNELTVGGVVMTATDGGTKTRIWKSTEACDLRVYKNGGSITFTAPEEFNISKIDFTGQKLAGFSVNAGKYSNSTWNGKAHAVTFSASNTCQVSTATITLVEAEPQVATSGTLTFKAQDTDKLWYATFSSEKDVVFTSDVVVYGVSVSNEKLSLNALGNADYDVTDTSVGYNTGIVEKGYYVPANNGVLVISLNGTTPFYFPKEVQSVSLPENMLKPAPVGGGVFTSEEGYKYYKLAYNDYYAKTGLGFYWGAKEAGAFQVKAGLAYMAVPAAVANNAKGFRFDGVTDGIDGVSMDSNKAQVIYNINGQRVANMSKAGLYIVNGKKVVVK